MCDGDASAVEHGTSLSLLSPASRSGHDRSVTSPAPSRRRPLPRPAGRLPDACDLFLDEEVRNVDLRTWPGGEPEGLRDLLRGQGWRVVRPGAERET